MTAGLQSRVDIFNPLQNLSVGFLFLPERSRGGSTGCQSRQDARGLVPQQRDT